MFFLQEGNIIYLIREWVNMIVFFYIVCIKFSHEKALRSTAIAPSGVLMNHWDGMDYYHRDESIPLT